MCTPTRACLMTGRYPFRCGLLTAVIPSVSSYGLEVVMKDMAGEPVLPTDEAFDPGA